MANNGKKLGSPLPSGGDLVAKQCWDFDDLGLWYAGDSGAVSAASDWSHCQTNWAGQRHLDPTQAAAHIEGGGMSADIAEPPPKRLRRHSPVRQNPNENADVANCRISGQASEPAAPSTPPPVRRIFAELPENQSPPRSNPPRKARIAKRVAARHALDAAFERIAAARQVLERRTQELIKPESLEGPEPFVGPLVDASDEYDEARAGFGAPWVAFRALLCRRSSRLSTGPVESVGSTDTVAAGSPPPLSPSSETASVFEAALGGPAGAIPAAKTAAIEDASTGPDASLLGQLPTFEGAPSGCGSSTPLSAASPYATPESRGSLTLDSRGSLTPESRGSPTEFTPSQHTPGIVPRPLRAAAEGAVMRALQRLEAAEEAVHQLGQHVRRLVYECPIALPAAAAAHKEAVLRLAREQAAFAATWDTDERLAGRDP